ncbi:MAG: hypothetical protein GXP03_10720, partial [Alphaproteobacteria bacterium]|nr:hypothetical protein [Alphaproteobacteria bacterium]
PTITDYLYVVAFSDWTKWQGTLGTFLDNNSLQLIGSGSAGWQVFATGVSKQANYTPTLAEVNAQIALANGSLGILATSSGGWVGPGGGGGTTVGRLVTESLAAAPWPQVCGMDPVASWMWYQDDLDPNPGFNAFTDQPATPGKNREFLIFRLPVRTFPASSRFARWPAPG